MLGFLARLLILAACVSVSSAALADGARDGCPAARADYRRLAAEAYVWGYPLIRSAQLRQNMTLPEDPLRARPATTAGAPINRLGHARELATPETRQGVAPNNDTLYSLAWIDTAAGPFVFEAPDFGARYYTFQMGQADTSTDLAFGQSTHGAQLPPIFILGAGQDHRVPPGMIGVRATQRYFMLAGRTLVKDRADVAEVWRLQDMMRLRTWADYRAGHEKAAQITAQQPIERRDPPADDPEGFLGMMGSVLADWRATGGDRRFLRSLAPLGLAQGRLFDPRCLPPAALPQIALGLREGRAAIEQRTRDLGTSINGWTVNHRGSQFGADRLLRAAVAMDQIYVLPAREALYMIAKSDSRGRQLDGNRSYVLRFEAGKLPPAGAFWSATIYYAKGFLVANPIGRHSIGDRTPGLVRGADGSIEIRLQHAAPADSGANWLPVPSEPFTVMLRLYRPGEDVMTRKWLPPAIVEVPAD
ncbi:MAG: DUF1214 domain-containing protein [Erythrobacter sp.]|uniref:DUF1254 domain-containing protein n=1 Tax=Erythrobacter sp. TaxID=1042 RepID=UPI0025F60A96|nr:DUF1214 domain-containing protein [Erythrobacter sp.]MCL9998793.1 DUF1214 domain-containing protein [Erythrobacter sp.]